MAKETTQSQGDAYAADQLEASADTALAALTQAGATATALVQEWIRRGNAAAVAVAAEKSAGPTRKAARRGLNVLKSRGVAIPQRQHIAKVGGEATEVTQEAWLMAPDTTGSLLVVIASRAPTRRYLSTSVVLHDMLGLQRIETAELSQSQLKESMARVLPGAEYKPVSVPVEWARWRIAEARKRNRERGIPLPLGLDSASRLLEPAPTKAPPHPLDEEGLVLSEADAQEMSKTSGRLHALPEFRAWFPSRSAVEEMMLKVGETLTPGQEPDQADLQQTLEQEIRAATDRYFSPQRREQLAGWMQDSALSVLQRAGEQPALEVVAAIKAIRAAGLITNPPHEIPFLRAFFDKAVGLMVAQGGGQLRIPIRKRPEEPEALLEEAEEAEQEDADEPASE